jgi:hypothetical protein
MLVSELCSCLHWVCMLWWWNAEWVTVWVTKCIPLSHSPVLLDWPPSCLCYQLLWSCRVLFQWWLKWWWVWVTCDWVWNVIRWGVATTAHLLLFALAHPCLHSWLKLLPVLVVCVCIRYIVNICSLSFCDQSGFTYSTYGNYFTHL